MFQEGTWPSNPLVDKEGSGLTDISGVYEIPDESIMYFKVSNKFEYAIDYNPVEIVDNKFVMNDVEFYVVRTAAGSVNSIYFNEF